MERIQPIVRLLLECPEWSNTSIARQVGCDRRRVRRYRDLLAATDLAPEVVAECDAATLHQFFNARRSPPRRHDPPDFTQLRRRHPETSGRELWRTYIAEQEKAGAGPMSYAQFMRWLRESAS